jgi:hypothetical protein
MSAMLIILTLSLLILASTITTTSADITELNVNPQIVVPGDLVLISGKASPNEVVWLSSSFELSLPVSGGKYSCDFTDIYFSKGEKKFSVTAENVKNIRASLSPVFWQTIEYPLSGPESAKEEGIATLSISFPATMHGAKIDISGKKNVKVYGDAAEGATSVNLKSAMSIKVSANSTGYFELDINTGGAPKGKFLITAGGIEKAVKIVSVEDMPTPSSSIPSPSPSPISSPQKTTKPFRIPSFGFEVVGGIAIAAFIMIIIFIMRKRKGGG